MVKRGCCYEELASDESELMCCLGKYIDVEQLAREEKGGFTLTHPPTLSHLREHSGNRSPDYRTLEGASEELALRELLKAAEEPDITDFIKTF